MTKAEELKILEAIEGLIAESGANSYIRMTFAGICDVCRNNIMDDFGDSPVIDLNELRGRFDFETRAHDVTKKQLADAQKALKESLDLNEKLRKTADEWEQNAHDAGEMYAEENTACMKMAREIMKLKAEIVRLRMERMTEDDLATMYEKMEGAN